MSSYQHSIRIDAQTPGGNVSKSNDYTGEQHTGYANEALPGGAATTIPNFSVDVSGMVSLLIKCDRDVDLTFNDDGTPDATVNLLANKPLTWTNDGYFDNPLGIVDITSFKATLAAGADADFLIDVCYD